LSFGLTAAAALSVYLATMGPHISLEYSGYLSTVAAYAGVPHPPGYPVWTLYSWLFTRLLPFGNVAWRVAASSAVAAALACGLVALMVSRGGKLLGEGPARPRSGWLADRRLARVVCGYAAGMALGLSGALWPQAVVAETWALTTLLFAVVLCLLLRWTAAPQRRRSLYGACLAFGLVLTSNQELVVLTPAILAWVFLVDAKLGRDLALLTAAVALGGWAAHGFGAASWFASFTHRNWPLLVAMSLLTAAALAAIVWTGNLGSAGRPAALCAAMVLLGLAACLYLPVASMTNPPVNWGYPRTIDGFLHVLSRGQYEQAQPAHGLGPVLGVLWLLVTETGRRFGWLYLLFSPLPLCCLPWTAPTGRRAILGLAGVLVCVGPLLVLTLNPAGDRASLDLVSRCFCALHVVLAVFTGLGLLACARLIEAARAANPAGFKATRAGKTVAGQPSAERGKSGTRPPRTGW
jgi:hypothetical protein